MLGSDVNALVEGYAEALLGAAFEAYPLTPDAVFRGPRLGPVRGADAVREVLAQVASAFQDFEIVVAGRLVEGSEAVLFLDVTLPDGRGFAVADHLVFRDGALAVVRPYFDAGLLESLGVAPTIGQLGPAARL